MGSACVFRVKSQHVMSGKIRQGFRLIKRTFKNINSRFAVLTNFVLLKECGITADVITVSKTLT